jgi:hypothetical protein
MESAVSSFALTIGRQLDDVEQILTRIDSQSDTLEEIDIADVDIDDPAFESLLVGRKIKVLLKDVDLVRWKQDLVEDKNRLGTLLAAARQVSTIRDKKLTELKNVIEGKCRNPINPGNKKLIVFNAFADTAHYLYENLASWAKDQLGLETALVTGTGRNQTTLHGLRKDLGSILSAFAPRSKERPEELASEGELNLLIATDCISEGQNLRLAYQLRHSLESGQDYSEVRAYRPYQFAKRTHSARQLLAQYGAGGIHKPRATRERTHGAPRHFGHW